MSFCTLCPRECGADREITTGVCGCDSEIRVARVMLHHFEEPSISGSRGSGAVFFCGCPLGCVFCQNRPISSPSDEYFAKSKVVSGEELVSLMLRLQEAGAHNVNFVSPTQHTDSIIRASISGVVANVKIAAGQHVNKSDVLFTMYRTQDYQICFSIPEEELSQVNPGDKAKLYFNWNEDKSEPFEGTVTEVSYVSEEKDGEVAYSGYISFTPDETVRLGMNVSVAVEDMDE